MSEECFDEDGECLYEVETDDVLAMSYAIEDGDFVMYVDNGATDLRAIVKEENMEPVIRAYAKRHPEWLTPQGEVRDG